MMPSLIWRMNPVTRLVITAAAVVVVAIGFIVSARVPLKAAVRVSRTTIHVGDTITYSLAIDARKDIVVDTPDLDSFFAGFSVRDRKRSVDDTLWRRLYRYTYFITKEDAGTCAIGALAIRYRPAAGGAWLQKTLEGYTITVRSLLPTDAPHKAKITIGGGLGGKLPQRVGRDEGTAGRSMDVDTTFAYDVKEVGGPKDILTVQDIVIMVLVSAALLIVLILSAWYLYDKAAKKALPPPPPDVIALDRLKALKPEAVPTGTLPKDLCAALSRILKDYLKARYGMEPLEKTSREFLAELESLAAATDQCRAAVRAVLMTCDLAQYAGVIPPPPELLSAVASVKRVVEETRAVS